MGRGDGGQTPPVALTVAVRMVATAMAAGAAFATASCASTAPGPSPSPVGAPFLSCQNLAGLDTLTIYRADAFPQNGSRFTFPADVTTRNASMVRAVAAALCALPSPPPGTRFCPADFGIGYRLDFMDGGQSMVPVSVEATGCENVYGLPTQRTAVTAPGLWSTLGGAMGVANASAAAFAGTRGEGTPAPTANSSVAATPTAPPATPAPSATPEELNAVAAATISPTGKLCDTHRDNAPGDVNACPYTQRLKDFVNARYQRAWNGQANPNPVLSAQPACSDGNDHVSYAASSNGPGGIVTIITCGQADQAWQKLVLVRSGEVLLVDDILLDSRHQGNFASVYASG